MSDTPETDAAAMRWYGERDAVCGEVARNLERQRNEALQLARELRDALRRLSEEWSYQEKLGHVPSDRVEATFATDALTKANQLLK